MKVKYLLKSKFSRNPSLIPETTSSETLHQGRPLTALDYYCGIYKVKPLIQ